ncbi:hypothetical protein FBT96_17375 [Rhodobacter capsulatus]|uniref:DUF3016 domain-containing protein n=1 Tax=Rhodobacter capsulatus TaxID=1061 RepID=A0A4U1JM39_RHOCA|nr:hypothetical protein [Rhodobacter capsulatus]TKD15390.1 hypothetical protein FBT96_17375 [Rhodobacter capsulatus]
MSRPLPVRLLTVATLIGVALSTAALASDDRKVSAIDVQIDLAALSNAAAARHYATIEADLENALTSRLVDRTDKDGLKITVDLSEFELSNSWKEAMNLADTRLVGTVSFTDAKNNSNFDNWQQTVDVNATARFLPEGTELAKLKPDSDVYYKAMIASFADAVVQRLDQ